MREKSSKYKTHVDWPIYSIACCTALSQVKGFSTMCCNVKKWKRFLLVLISLLNRASSTEEDGAVARFISVTSGREASIEYEPCRPGKGFSPHRTVGVFTLSRLIIPDVFCVGHPAQAYLYTPPVSYPIVFSYPWLHLPPCRRMRTYNCCRHCIDKQTR